MPEYVTYYAVSEDIPNIESIYMTWPVGECADGTVYLCLDRESLANSFLFDLALIRS